MLFPIFPREKALSSLSGGTQVLVVQVGEGFRFRAEIVLDSESIVSTNHSNHLQHSVRNA